MVELVSVSVPLFSIPPPFPVVLPPVIVSPERDAVTPESTWKHSARPAAADNHPRGGASDRGRQGCVAELELGRQEVIVCWVAKTVGSKLIVGAGELISQAHRAGSSEPGGRGDDGASRRLDDERGLEGTDVDSGRHGSGRARRGGNREAGDRIAPRTDGRAAG